MNSSEFLNTKQQEIEKNIEILKQEKDRRVFDFIRLGFTTSVLTFTVSALSLLVIKKRFFEYQGIIFNDLCYVTLGSGFASVPLYLLNDQRMLFQSRCENAIKKLDSELGDYRHITSLYGNDDDFHNKLKRVQPVVFRSALRDINRSSLFFKVDKKHLE